MARRRSGEEKNSMKFWMSIFIVVTMVFSVFGILIGSSSSELRYNKFKFNQDDTYGYYVAKINNEEVYFYSFPTEVIYINLTEAALAKIRNAAFIITTFDPSTSNESTQAIELARFDLAKFLKGKSVFSSVSVNTTGYEALPVLTCANATAGAPVLVFNISSKMDIVDAGDCIYLNGQGPDFAKLRDRILYGYYGVI